MLNPLSDMHCTSFRTERSAAEAKVGDDHVGVAEARVAHLLDGGLVVEAGHVGRGQDPVHDSGGGGGDFEIASCRLRLFTTRT